MSNYTTLFLVLGGILLVTVPAASTYFRMANTLTHEIGHVLMALCMRGGVRKIELFPTTAGLATTLSPNWFSSVMIGIAGYPFASLVAAASAYTFANWKIETFLLVIMVTLGVSVLIWVRNLFGVVWTLAFFSTSTFAYLYSESSFAYYYGLFIVIILLTESVRSSFVILTISYRNKEQAGDAQALARLTKIPTLIWGLLFFIQSILFFCIGLFQFGKLLQ